MNFQQQLNNKCLYIIPPAEVETIKAKGYNWQEVHTVKDRRGIEYLKLIEVNKNNV